MATKYPNILDVIANHAKERQPDNRVNIIVGTGPNKATYVVPKKRLIESSEFFNKALSNGFVETTTRTIELIDCNIDVMQLFNYWLDDREMYSLPDLGSSRASPKVPQHQITIDLYIRAWVFADKYLVEWFKEDLLQGILDLINDWDGPACLRPTLIRRTFALTPPDSIMRLILVREVINVVSGQSELSLDPSSLETVPGFMALYFREYKAAAKICNRRPSEWFKLLDWGNIDLYQ